MDNKEAVLEILDSYEEITITDAYDGVIFFELKGKVYGCLYPEIDQDTSSPIFLVKNDDEYDYPHILPSTIPTNVSFADKYRCLCLYEHDSTIKFLLSYEEKLRDSVERLIHLLSLTALEREKEFQKEFLYYWNDRAVGKHSVSLYIGQNESLQKMNAYRSDKGEIRFVSIGMHLTDANKEVDGRRKWNHVPELPVFYIPIIDKRRILPPTRDRIWTAENILMIICGREYNRISHESYLKLGKEKIKTKQVGLVFEMVVDGNHINFATIVSFKSSKNDTVLNKLRHEIEEVATVKSKRVDYYHLCRQIGNDTQLLNKKVLLIGAGSLGSYAAREIVRAGVKELVVYDEDQLEEENILRHIESNFWVGCSKVIGLKYELEQIHPEIHVNAINENIDEDSLIRELETVDLAIFTVGSSDVQLKLNKVLKAKKCRAKVIYVWLEAGGTDSHILVVDYSKQGCFQCLFTDVNGKLINNKANNTLDSDISIYRIRNGCGATRVAYGNTILLRTVSVMLTILQNVFSETDLQNTLLNITPTEVIDVGNSFVEKKCRCCGNENNE